MSSTLFKHQPKWIIIAAPSGTGKSTLCKMLLKKNKDLMLSISTTTRSPRGNEQEGKDYFFVSKDKFQDLIEQEGFIEWAKVHDQFYGTTKAFVESAEVQNKSLLLDIDVQGAQSFKQKYGKKAVTIFLIPPSLQELEKRLRGRQTDTEETIQKRLKNAIHELSFASQFDYQIENQDLEKAYSDLEGILKKELYGIQIA